MSSTCRQFSLDEIKEATNNFDEKKVVGHGGEGEVYLAEIYLGSENEKSRVAVKHLKENSNEFEKEIRTITKIQHPHLVSLLGYCDESDQKILIYEYMEKGSLSDYLKRRNSGRICLSWKQRLEICLGAAYGLQHLHKETNEFPKGIIHRDVKPANILLGQNWVAKVSDFGTFKVSIAGQTSSAVKTDLKGTIGYYAPEYFRSLQITRKIDVYAFGVVLFEVLCRKKPWDRGDESYYVGENEDLGLWAQENVDTKIKTEISHDSLKAFTDIIGRSLKWDPNKRPTMDGVILALKNALKCQEPEDEQISNNRLKANRAVPRTLPTPRASPVHHSRLPLQFALTTSSWLSGIQFADQRPPDGLLEFVDRVYVFDSCFSTEVRPEGLYQLYLHKIITKLREEFPKSSFLAFNYQEGEKRSQFAKILCKYDVTVMDYPRPYEGCPLLPLSVIHSFLRVCESWLMRGNHQNVILLHCERGGWLILAFLLASFLVFRKLPNGEREALEIVYREAPKGLVQLLSPLDPFPSQLRYLQYISRRNLSPEWPPRERVLSLDCLILRAIPSFDNQNGCRPIIRIFGRKLPSKDGLSTQMLFSMPKRGRSLRSYSQMDSDVIKIDIQCLVQGDVVLECVHLDLDPEREVMMFRVMFNTAFIRSNILMLNCENLDILWDSKGRYPKSFRAEVLFGDIESMAPLKALKAYSRVQELFNGVEWADSNDDAAAWLTVLNDLRELSMPRSRVSTFSSPFDSKEENNASSVADSLYFLETEKANNLAYTTVPGANFHDDSLYQDYASDEASDPIPVKDPFKPIIPASVDSIVSAPEVDVRHDPSAALTSSNQAPAETVPSSLPSKTTPSCPSPPQASISHIDSCVNLSSPPPPPPPLSPPSSLSSSNSCVGPSLNPPPPPPPPLTNFSKGSPPPSSSIDT